MSDALLTFEITEDDGIEVFGNASGFRSLIEVLQRVLEYHDHEHLMTEDWGGHELSSETQGLANKLVHHVRLVPVPESEGY